MARLSLYSVSAAAVALALLAPQSKLRPRNASAPPATAPRETLILLPPANTTMWDFDTEQLVV